MGNSGYCCVASDSVSTAFGQMHTRFFTEVRVGLFLEWTGFAAEALLLLLDAPQQKVRRTLGKSY